MSRGHGKVEATILETLTNNPGRGLSAQRLACIVYGLQPDPAGMVTVSVAQHASVRRALSNLHKQGKVFNLGRFDEPGNRGNKGARPRSMWASEETARADAEYIAKKYGPQSMNEELRALVSPQLD